MLNKILSWLNPEQEPEPINVVERVNELRDYGLVFLEEGKLSSTTKVIDTLDDINQLAINRERLDVMVAVHNAKKIIHKRMSVMGYSDLIKTNEVDKK